MEQTTSLWERVKLDVSTQTDTLEKLHKSRMSQTCRYSTKDKSVQYSQQSKSVGVQASVPLMDQVTQTKSNPLHNILKCQSVGSPMQQDFESDTLSSPEKAPISDDSDYTIPQLTQTQSVVLLVTMSPQKVINWMTIHHQKRQNS